MLHMLCIIGYDLGFQKPFFRISIHKETFRKKLIFQTVLLILFHEWGLSSHLHLSILALYDKHIVHNLNRRFLYVYGFCFG